MSKYFFVLLLLSLSCTTSRNIQLALYHDFPDPCVIFADGKYFAYATGESSKNDKKAYIQIAESHNLKEWKLIGGALHQKPTWGNVHFWAPHVLYDKKLNKFVLFYSAAKDENTPKCIGVAFSEKATGPFVDMGKPLICGNKNDKNNFINIDPMAFTDPATNKKFLFWGSGHEPIKVQEMNDDWTAFKENSKPVNIMSVNIEAKYTKLLEGAWVDYYKGKYYLYFSGDNCCGPQASYAVFVARSDNVLGPYQTYGQYKGDNNSVILSENSRWVAMGHNAIFTGQNKKKYIAFHASKKRKNNTHSKSRYFFISRIKYINGWPKLIFN